MKRSATRLVHLRTLTAALMTLWLSACNLTLPQRPNPESAQALDEHIRLAQRQEQRDDIPGALFHWQIAAALAPGSRRVEQNIERLERRRAESARRLKEAGTGDLDRGNSRRGKKALLQAWALDPSDRETRALLRKLEQDRLERQMTAKVETSRRALARNGSRSAEPKNAEELVYVAGSNTRNEERRPSHGQGAGAALLDQYLERAERDFRQGRYDAALKGLEKAQRMAGSRGTLADRIADRRKGYADWLYGNGVWLAKRDRQRALALWRLALRFEPGHAEARAGIRRLAPH